MTLPRSAAYRVFWLGRYLERAEGNARIVRLAHSGRISWAPALDSLGIDPPAGAQTPEAVASYLVFDESNAASIRSAVAFARENANGAIPDAVYCEINRIHLSFAETSFERVGIAGLDKFLSELLDRIRRLEERIEEIWA